MARRSAIAPYNRSSPQLATANLTEELQQSENESRLDEQMLMSLGYDSNPGHGSTAAKRRTPRLGALKTQHVCRKDG